jgi:mRNA interferase RelE/StbE
MKRLGKDPFLGKPLRGNLSGKWSIRIGDYRIIYAINESEKTIMLHDVGHRKTAYK